MAFMDEENDQLDRIMRAFHHKKRPQEDARHQVDLSYEITNQSVEILLLRSFWMVPSQTVREPIAKATYLKKSGIRGTRPWCIMKPSEALHPPSPRC